MFIKLTRAWVSSITGEYVYIEVYGNRGFEERYCQIDSNHMQSQIRHFDTAYEAFCAMEQLHEDKSYEEI